MNELNRYAPIWSPRERARHDLEITQQLLGFWQRRARNRAPTSRAYKNLSGAQVYYALDYMEYLNINLQSSAPLQPAYRRRNLLDSIIYLTSRRVQEVYGRAKPKLATRLGQVVLRRPITPPPAAPGYSVEKIESDWQSYYDELADYPIPEDDKLLLASERLLEQHLFSEQTSPEAAANE